MSRNPDIFDRLFSLRRFGIRPGLERTHTALRYFLRDADLPPSLIVAGTNGKGSVAHSTAALLTVHGITTGLFTSPHMLRFSERFRVNGREIGDERLSELVRDILKYLDRTGNELTFFEASTVMAARYFHEEKVDFAVYETGMGGEWDAVNAMFHKYGCITTVGIEHSKYLGNTEEKILATKAGIIKEGQCFATGITDARHRDYLSKICADRDAEFLYPLPVEVTLKEIRIEGTDCDVQTQTVCVDDLFFSLAGDYQIENLRLAVSLFERIIEDTGVFLDIRSIREALGGVSIYGRLTILRDDPLVVFDCAHNPQAMKRLVSSLKYCKPDSRWTVIAGFLEDKDYGSMIDMLGLVAEKMYFINPDIAGRGRSPDICESYARNAGYTNTQQITDDTELKKCLSTAQGPVLITGSCYMAEAAGLL